MQVELKIVGEAADLQGVFAALANLGPASTPLPPTPAPERKSSTRKPGDNILVSPAATTGTTPEPPATTGAAPEPPATTGTAPEPPKTTTTEEISFDDFRVAIGKKAMINKKAVQDIARKYGSVVTKEIDPKHYTAILEDIKAIV